MGGVIVVFAVSRSIVVVANATAATATTIGTMVHCFTLSEFRDFMNSLVSEFCDTISDDLQVLSMYVINPSRTMAFLLSWTRLEFWFDRTHWKFGRSKYWRGALVDGRGALRARRLSEASWVELLSPVTTYCQTAMTAWTHCCHWHTALIHCSVAAISYWNRRMTDDNDSQNKKLDS